jgi:predicted Zn-dependent protease
MVRVAALALALTMATGCHPPAAATTAPLPPAAYAHYVRGRIALTGNDYRRAEDELRAAAAAAPDQPHLELARIRVIAKGGRAAEARAAATAATARWPRDPEAWLVVADLAREAGALPDARAAYDRAVTLDRGDETAYLGLAETWLKLGRPDHAEVVWRALLGHVPDSIDGHFRLADRLVDRGAAREAEQHLRAVLELDPDHIDARLELAHVLRRSGRLALAIAETRHAFDRAGGTMDVGEELFWLLLEADDRAGALDLLGLFDQTDAGAETRLAVARLDLILDEPDRASHQIEDVLAAAPAASEALMLRARIRYRSGDRAGALADLAAIPDDAPAAAAARALTAEDLLADGDAAGALAIATRARAAHPRSTALLQVTASAQHALGKDADARAMIAAAIRAHPDDGALFYAWALFEDSAGQHDTALAVIDRLLTAQPDHVDGLNFAGFALADAGRELPRAETLLAHARDLAPGDPLVLDSWGWLRHRQGLDGDAVKVLEHALRIAPGQAELWVHLAEIRLTIGDRRGARAALERARGAHPSPDLARRIEVKLTALPPGP